MSACISQEVPPFVRHLQRATIVTMAVALPLVVFGRGAMQGGLALALLLGLVTAWRGRFPVIALDRCRPVLLAMGVVAVAWLPSVAVSLDPLVSLGGWARTFTLVFGGLVLWSALLRDQDGYRLALKLFVVAAAVAAVSAAAVTGLVDVTHPVARSMKSKASAFAVLLPVIIYAGVTLRGRWLVLAALAFCGVVGLVLGTGSRSGMAGLAVACMVILSLYAIRHRRYWIVLISIAAALVMVSKAKPWERIYDKDTVRYELYLPHSMFDTHRQVIWRFTFHKFLEKPVFGWGINVINMSPGAGDLVPGMQQEFIPAHPHSWLVEVSAETGVVGFLALIGVLAWGFIRLGYGYLKRAEGAPALAGVGVMTVFWSSGAFNFSIWAVWWQLVLVIALAIVFGKLPGGCTQEGQNGVGASSSSRPAN